MRFSGHLLMALAIASFVVACGKNDKGSPQGAGTTLATVPQPSNACMTTLQPNSWSPYQQWGFGPYQGYGPGAYGQGGYGARGEYLGGPYGQYGQYGVISPVNWQSGWNGSWGNPGYPNQPYHPNIYQPNAGFCGCQPGTVPVCDNSRGMGCIDARTLQNQRYSVWHYNHQANSYSFGQWGQPGYQNGCYQGFTQTCIIGSLDCGRGAVCLATRPGSTVGVCVAN